MNVTSKTVAGKSLLGGRVGEFCIAMPVKDHTVLASYFDKGVCTTVIKSFKHCFSKCFFWGKGNNLFLSLVFAIVLKFHAVI